MVGPWPPGSPFVGGPAKVEMKLVGSQNILLSFLSRRRRSASWAKIWQNSNLSFLSTHLTVKNNGKVDMLMIVFEVETSLIWSLECPSWVLSYLAGIEPTSLEN